MFDKDDQEITQIIEAGLEAIVSGKATLEEVVAQHPEHAKALRSELEVALWLVSRKEQVAPRPGFVAASRKRVVARIKEEASNKGAKRSIFGFIWPQKIAYQWVAALMALIILFSGTGGLVTISQSALPGDGLYGIKRASETVALAVTVNEVRKVQLSTSFLERRVAEVAALVERGDATQVESALQHFERQVSETVSMLQGVDGASAHEKKQLARELQKQLTVQSGKLNDLQANATADMRAQLENASQLSAVGASLAGDEADRIFDPTETPTVTPVPSLTPSASPSPAPSETMDPTETMEPVPTDTEGVIGDLTDPSLVPDPANPTRLVTKTPRPTNENRPTPRPTNENKPTKQPDPGGGGSSGGGSSGGSGGGENPGKPDKPDKDKDK